MMLLCSVRYIYRWCDGTWNKCAVGDAISIETLVFTKNALDACTPYTATVFASTATTPFGRDSSIVCYTSVKGILVFCANLSCAIQLPL